MMPEAAGGGFYAGTTRMERFDLANRLRGRLHELRSFTHNDFIPVNLTQHELQVVIVVLERGETPLWP